MMNNLYRPGWTCGRYDRNKHAAIFYNLIAGMCYYFEDDSADVIGTILSKKRNTPLYLNDLSEETHIGTDQLVEFLESLISVGLLTDSEPTSEVVANYRTLIVADRRENFANVQRTLIEKLPFEHADAEMEFSEATGGLSVMFELTYQCSEQCIHCYNIGASRNQEEKSYRGAVKELSLHDYQRIIDDLYDRGLYKVCLTGGDPFSYPCIWEIIDYLYKKEIAFDIYTNGQRLAGHEEKLANYFPRLVAISIYSTDPFVHDHITRRPGSFSCSASVMEHLAILGVPQNLKCCILRQNMKTYGSVIDFANQVLAIPQFEISITDSIDGDKCASRFLRLRAEEMEIVLRDSNIPLYVGPEVPDYGKAIRDMDQNACGAGYNTFCVTPDGKLIPCCAFHLEFGDLKTSSFTEIITNSSNYREWIDTKLSQYDECGKYPYCDYCNLCPGNNYSEHGNAKKAGENNCFIAKVRHNLAEKMRNGEDVLKGKSVHDRLRQFNVQEDKIFRIFDKGKESRP